MIPDIAGMPHSLTGVGNVYIKREHQELFLTLGSMFGLEHAERMTMCPDGG